MELSKNSEGVFNFEAIINFGLRNSRLPPRYGGKTVNIVLNRVESNFKREDLNFKIVDLVKI
jgi:hypothetical protein